MFKNKTVKLNPEATDTLIGEGTIFEGKVKSEASIRIDGQIIGQIESQGSVTIGEKGLAKSDITAKNLLLAGRLVGNVEIGGTLTILATGSLIGNLTAGSLIIEAGGVFQGTSTMTAKDIIDTASAS